MTLAIIAGSRPERIPAWSAFDRVGVSVVLTVRCRVRIVGSGGDGLAGRDNGNR